MPSVCGWLLVGGTLITASLLLLALVVGGGGGTLLGSRATSLRWWGWLFVVRPAGWFLGFPGGWWWDRR